MGYFSKVLNKFKKQEIVENEHVDTYSASGSIIKITTKSGKEYELNSDQNLVETMKTIDHTRSFLYSSNDNIAIKASEIEAIEYIKLGGQSSEQSETV
jgi:hypothetical protein